MRFSRNPSLILSHSPWTIRLAVTHGLSQVGYSSTITSAQVEIVWLCDYLSSCGRRNQNIEDFAVGPGNLTAQPLVYVNI